MSARATRLVVERELREAARRKGIWALAGLTFLGSLVLVVAPDLLPDRDDNTRVMIAGRDRIGLTEALEAFDDPPLDLSFGIDRGDIADAIASREVDVGVVLGGRPVMVVEDERSRLVDIVAGVVADRAAAARLVDEGIDPDRVRTAFAESVPVIEPIDVERQDRETTAFAITFVLYLLTVILTSQVANSVAVEKSNRVSEVLVAIVPPRSLLFGKVIGVGLIGVVTLSLGAAPVAVRIMTGADLPTGIGRSLAASAVWFIGGLALYLVIAGVLGALVARQEEVGSTLIPLTVILLVSYFVALTAGESTASAVLAYVPLTSPMIVPFRVAIGAGSPVEYVASAVLLVAGVIVTSRIGSLVFRRAIVRTGRRLTLRDVLG